MTAVEPQVSVSGPHVGPPTARDVVAAYVGLMKPRVIELLLLTTVPVMFYAQRGVPPLGLVIGKIDFGSRVLFEPELGIGAQLSDRLSVEASWVHMSHGQLAGKENPGIDNLGARLNVAL